MCKGTSFFYLVKAIQILSYDGVVDSYLMWCESQLEKKTSLLVLGELLFSFRQLKVLYQNNLKLFEDRVYEWSF